MVFTLMALQAGKQITKQLPSGLGADEVVDYKTTKFEDALQGFDVVLDTVTQDCLGSE